MLNIFLHSPTKTVLKKRVFKDEPLSEQLVFSHVTQGKAY